MTLIPQSQAGQDRFAHELCGDIGSFIDIGAGLAIERSNTYALEQLGWRGWLLETQASLCEQLRLQRKSFVFEADANTINWSAMLPPDLTIDYLSLDVDASSLTALLNILKSIKGFRVATIEHDHYAYKDTPSPRQDMIDILKARGYDILCSDIANEGFNFEIWAVDPLKVDMAKAERFRRDGVTEWREFWP